MPELIVLVLDDANKVEEVLNAWLTAGIPGVTLLDSAGLGHEFSKYGARNDLPLIPSLSSFLRAREELSRTLFSVVPDGFDVDALISATEAITGPLNDPDTGILFVVPVSRARGLHPRRDDGKT
jgi:nitrogen regulatory protein PII